MAESSERPPMPDPTVLTTDQLVALEHRVMARLDERLQSQGRLTEEQFTSVNRRFGEIERNRIEQKEDTTKALDAAFAAAKEAVTGVDARVNDVRDRVTRMESNRAGLYAAAVIVAAVLGLLGFILANGANP